MPLEDLVQRRLAGVVAALAALSLVRDDVGTRREMALYQMSQRFAARLNSAHTSGDMPKPTYWAQRSRITLCGT